MSKFTFFNKSNAYSQIVENEYELDDIDFDEEESKGLLDNNNVDNGKGNDNDKKDMENKLLKAPSQIMSTNIDKSLEHYHNILHYSPYSSSPHSNLGKDDKIVGQWVALQVSRTLKPVEWKKLYMVVEGAVLRLKSSPDGNDRIVEYISYIDFETEAKHPNKEINESYRGNFEEKDIRNIFRVYTTSKILILRAPSDKIRSLIVDRVQKELSTRYGDDIFQSKKKAAVELAPLLIEQYTISQDALRCAIALLQDEGILGDMSILSATGKRMSGRLKLYSRSNILDLDIGEDEDKDSSGNEASISEEEDNKEINIAELEQDEIEDVWVDYFFVLLSGCLYYFRHTRSKEPSGFVSLRFSKVEIDIDALNNGEFIFRVITPYRTLTIMAKHAVSLATWLAALNKSVIKESRRQSVYFKNRQESKEEAKLKEFIMNEQNTMDSYLREIEPFIVPVSSLAVLLRNTTGIRWFKKFLKKRDKKNLADCLKQIKRLTKGKRTNIQRTQIGNKIFDTYVDAFGKHRIPNLPDDMVKKLKDDISGAMDLTVEVFKPLYLLIISELKKEFKLFKDHKYAEKFLNELRGGNKEEDDIKPFELSKNETLALSIDRKCRGKIVIKRLDMSKKSITIGRDIGNDVIIGDKTISRTHGRIEYTAKGAQYWDVGSSKGTRINGTRVTNCSLKIGDVIKLGKSKVTLIKHEKPLLKKIIGLIS